MLSKEKTRCLYKTTVWSGTVLGRAGAAPPLGSDDDVSAGMDEAQCALTCLC